MEKTDKTWQELNANNNNTVSIAEALSEYLRHWKWFIISALVCLAVGVGIVMTTQRTYRSSLSILLNEEKNARRAGANAAALTINEYGALTPTSNLDNEIAMLSSPDIMLPVVDSLNLQSIYYVKPRFRKEEIYGSSPFYVKYIGKKDFFPGKMDFFIVKSGNGFNVEGTLIRPGGAEIKIVQNIQHLPDSILLPDNLGGIVIKPTGRSIADAEKYYVTIVSPASMAGALSAGLSVKQNSEKASVLDLSLIANNSEKAVAVLNELIKQYNEMNVRVNNQMAYNTAIFINGRLKEIAAELGDVEREVVSYKQQHSITDLGAEAQMSIQQTGQNKDRLMDIETQLNVISLVERFVNNPDNKYKVVPNLGVSDPALSQIITEYNKKILTSDALLKNTGVENPTRVRAVEEIDNMRSSISGSIRNVEQAYKISRQDLQRLSGMTQSRIQSIPQQERGLLEKVRQQQIKETLFIFLMQKREETNMAIASTSDKARIIVSPQWKVWNIAPESKKILMGALIIGLLIPGIIIYIYNLLNVTVRGHRELAKLSAVSIIGEIGKNDSKEQIVVQANQTDGVSEMFRSLRNNLNFILKPNHEQIMLVTSTIASEGKTFISMNLALSFALSGKKVFLIGADIRRPKLKQYLGGKEKKGLVDMLVEVDDMTEAGYWKKYVYDSGLDTNLKVMYSGTIPPNPNELLISSKLGSFLAQMRHEYDLVILDSAPVGLVSDSYLINQYTDVTVYVVRENVTPKASVNFINMQKAENKLNSMYLVYNDSKLDNTYRYGYGKKYGYSK